MSENSSKNISTDDKNKAQNIDNNSIEDNNNENENHSNYDLSEDMDTNEDLSSSLDKSVSQQLSQNSIKSNVSEDQNSTKSEKSIKTNNKTFKRNNSQKVKDNYCWDCHKEQIDISCRACPRSYHMKCQSVKNKSKTNAFNQLNDNKNEFLCPECADIVSLEEGSTTSGAMSWLNGDVTHLSQLLKYTIITVKTADRNKTFSKPVSHKEWPEYHNFIVNPMDLSTIEKNVKNKTYASTQSFFADVKWIYHNCAVFNSQSGSAYINEAKNIIRVAKQECEEIEICPDCYYNYYSLEETDYFAATCRKPHAIVWAKLSGHPYWPAKVVRHDAAKQLIDIRFFGTHDKCWLKPENCYFMSKEYPYNKKPSKFDENKFNEAIRDMNSHLDQLDVKHPGMFSFYEKNTYFSVDKLYLTKAQNMNDRKVIQSFNGVKIRNLRVNPSKFDITNGIQLSNREYDDSDEKKPPNKKIKRSISSNSSLDSPKANTERCFSKSMAIRHALNSSESRTDTESTVTDEKSDAEVEKSVDELNCNHNSDEIMKEINVENKSSQINTVNSEVSNDFKSNTCSTHLKTVTVSGKSSEILHINKADKSVKNKSIHKLTNQNIEISAGSENLSQNEIRNKSKSKMSDKSIQISEIEKLYQKEKEKNKSLSMKIRQIKEEKSKLEVKLNESEDDREELKYKLIEFERSIEEIKRKQWCNNCLKEAILPCCWNTCYCTVECQHKHWPTHAKSCRRKQMIQNKS